MYGGTSLAPRDSSIVTANVQIRSRRHDSRGSIFSGFACTSTIERESRAYTWMCADRDVRSCMEN
ncbi:hypothetical protein V1477_018134 [Vespula maculifrons]|uniref:Uncharacterized protein n=1 Tax=Vespula maculifrons TaxID=7453 RepID=A0ABD2AYL1_VESMC